MATDSSEKPVRVYGCSAKGRDRKENEDRYLITTPAEDALLLAVADGMGNGRGGAHAAETIMLQMTRFTGLDRIRSRLMGLVSEIDLAIFNSANVEMGATCTVVLLVNHFAYYVHVGDSRMYLFRNGRLLQITRDQNMAQFLVEEGKLSPEEARTHHSRHLLDQCVGCGHCEPEQGSLEIHPGDIVLLTTDGIHHSIHIEEMTDILIRQEDIRTKTIMLLEAALSTGTGDDGTVVMAKINV